MKAPQIFLVILVVGLTCCTGRHKLNDVVQVEAVAKATTTLIWEQRKSFEIQLALTNLGAKPLVTFFGAMSCSRGDTKGQLKFVHLGIGERAINLGPNESKNLRYKCILDAVQEAGPFRVNFGPIMANPSGDGKSPGDQLAPELKISILPEGTNDQARLTAPPQVSPEERCRSETKNDSARYYDCLRYYREEAWRKQDQKRAAQAEEDQAIADGLNEAARIFTPTPETKCTSRPSALGDAVETVCH